jgi:hypothetical protein
MFSLIIAISIYVYTKFNQINLSSHNTLTYHTYIKKPNRSIASHSTTNDEFNSANITAAYNNNAEDVKKKLIEKNTPMRSNRILIGENITEYENEKKDLEFVNTPKKEWKSLLGEDLLSFQEEDTKVIVKEEYPVIKVSNNKGIYMEQVIVTFILKNGNQNSFRALIDSESGKVIETWDRTIHERLHKQRIDLTPVPLTGAIVK